MILTFLIWLGAILVSLVTLLCLKQKTAKTVLLITAILTAVSGIIIYGTGYSFLCDQDGAAVYRTLYAVIRVFLGEDSFGDISSAPIFAYPVVHLLFWFMHFAGAFATAAAALLTFGKIALKRLRLLLDRKKELSVIYGVTEQTLFFARQLCSSTGGNVILVGSSEFTEENLQDNCCHFREDFSAMEGGTTFLKSIGLRPGFRKFHLYCLSEDPFSDRIYAEKILAALEKLGISSEQTALTLLSPEQLTLNSLQAGKGGYGYGSVDLLDEPELAARMLMLRFPPHKEMSFDQNGKATTDLNCLMVGFGEIGQAVLRALVRNGQFEGSRFRVDIFDPEYESRSGKVRLLCPGLFEQYDIRFHAEDGRSEAMYRFLAEYGRKLRYIVLACGAADVNSALSRELTSAMHRIGCHAMLCLCDTNNIRCISDEKVEQYALYDPAVLHDDALDQRAMELNHYYCGQTELTAKKTWQQCDYFSRCSSRASADFAEAMAHIAGELIHTSWKPTDPLLENMARTEHLRWCAFHYTMGFLPMSEAEFDDRCRQFKENLVACGEGKLRIGKDLVRRRHICLTPWENLDRISEKESSARGETIDYKQLDRNNVLLLPTLVAIKKG